MDVQAFFPAFSLSRLFRGFFDGFFEELWKLWMSRLFLFFGYGCPGFFLAGFCRLWIWMSRLFGLFPAFPGCPGFSGFC
jgi:hypothetical protein